MLVTICNIPPKWTEVWQICFLWKARMTPHKNKQKSNKYFIHILISFQTLPVDEIFFSDELWDLIKLSCIKIQFVFVLI